MRGHERRGKEKREEERKGEESRGDGRKGEEKLSVEPALFMYIALFRDIQKGLFLVPRHYVPCPPLFLIDLMEFSDQAQPLWVKPHRRA